MAKLDYNEILKYDTRQVLFYEMLKNGSSFEVAFDKGSTQIAGTVVIEKLCYKQGNMLVNIPFTTDSQVLGKIQTQTTNVYMQVKMDFSIEINDLPTLSAVIKKLEQLPNIVLAKRKI